MPSDPARPLIPAMAMSVPPYRPPAHLALWPVQRLRAVVMRNDPTLRCRKDPEPFFANKTVPVARALCTGCPIRDECAELALREESSGYISGIRGGMSPRERRALIRERRTGTPAGQAPVKPWELRG